MIFCPFIHGDGENSPLLYMDCLTSSSAAIAACCKTSCVSWLFASRAIACHEVLSMLEQASEHNCDNQAQEMVPDNDFQNSRVASNAAGYKGGPEFGHPNACHVCQPV